MSDLINRQDAIDSFTTVDMGGTFCYCDSIVRTLENLPSEQPEITLESAIDYLNSIDWLPEHDRIITESAKRKSAQRKGKWKEVYAETDYRNGWIEFSCECCEYQHGLESGEYGWHFGEPIPWKYCPMCGARMVSEDEM